MVQQALRPELSAIEIRFVNDRSFSVAASIDEDGRPWALPLLGPPGRLFEVLDATTVRIAADIADGDPLRGNIAATGELGVTVDFVTGRTLQLTGRGRVVASPTDDPFSVRTLMIDIDDLQVTDAAIGSWTDIEPFELRPGLVNPATPYLR